MIKGIFLSAGGNFVTYWEPCNHERERYCARSQGPNEPGRAPSKVHATPVFFRMRTTGKDEFSSPEKYFRASAGRGVRINDNGALGCTG